MAISDNQVVSIEYSLTQMGESEILDSNKGYAPLEFIVGKGQIIPGLEESIKTMSKGDSRVVEVLAVAAYGERDPKALETLPREQFVGIELEKGMQLYGQSEGGQTVMVTVADFDEDSVTVDYNHPLAGKDLAFDVTIKDVRDATEEEINTGVVGGYGSGCGIGGYN
jgi:FKBP-type peptidyl-prolyl cis-trans isomerase SlyD